MDIFSGNRDSWGFSWPCSGRVRFFMFKVLPFGLSYACFSFTTLRRPLVKRLRSMSHCCFVYLDDAISGLPERVSAIVACLMQIELLRIEQD